MSIKRILTSVILACGIALVGGAAAVILGGMPTTGFDKIEVLAAQELEVPVQINMANVEAAWRSWMVRNGVTQSSFAIGLDGEILHSSAQARSADMAYPMASLSKAITGMCLNQILAESSYSWDSTLADLAPEFDKMNFTPAAEMADLTLVQIATHTSGLPKALTYGTTSIRAANLSSQPAMTRAALQESSNFGPRGSRVYSNANYAILGFLIEAMTGEPYSDYCAAHIMAPAGATEAGVVGQMAYTAGYGGWSVSVEDYARFAMFWFDPIQPWMETPSSFAYDSDAHYGMGANVHLTAGGTVVSHNGRWTHDDPHKPNIGALFLVRADGVTIVVNWDGSFDYALYDELYEVLYDAL